MRPGSAGHVVCGRGYGLLAGVAAIPLPHVAQLVEATGLNPVQWGFETSHADPGIAKEHPPMPKRPARPCSHPACPALVRGRSSTCPEHSRQRASGRASTRRPGQYDTAWQRRRRAYLYAHPWCVLCGRPATVPDHYPLSRAELVRQGVADPDADRYLRPLCAACHNRETAQHQPGGWAYEARVRRVTGESR